MILVNSEWPNRDRTVTLRKWYKQLLVAFTYGTLAVLYISITVPSITVTTGQDEEQVAMMMEAYILLVVYRYELSTSA